MYIQSTSKTNSMRKLLNLYVDNLSMQEVLETLREGVVFTPNADHFVKLQDDQEFLEAYSQADYRLCDSKIVCYAAKFLGTPIKEKISGSDFFPRFYRYHRNNESIKIFLLGGWDNTAAKAKEKINQLVGRDIVVGTYSPRYGFEKDSEECAKIAEMVTQSGATVLAVGVGSPKQEKFIVRHKHKMPNVKIFMAIGATINFEAGVVSRAPRWMSDAGLEWLFRLMCEPRRLWKRYLVEDPRFAWFVLMQKLNLYQAPFQPEEDYSRLRPDQDVSRDSDLTLSLSKYSVSNSVPK